MMQKLFALFTIIILTNGYHSFGQEKAISNRKDTLIIEGNSIWIRDYPKTGKVLFKLNEGSKCRVLQKGEKQVIKGLEDFWYKVEHENKVGWVFGSQSSLRQKASFDNFESFLKYFVQTCMLESNLDSLLFYKSPVIEQYRHNQIGFLRLFSTGAACTEWNYESPKYPYKYFLEKVQLKYYKSEQSCVECTNADGIYYQHTKSFPRYYINDMVEVDFPLSPKYQKAEKIKVVIWIDEIKWSKLYFIKADNRWWFVIKQDCGDA